MINKKFRENIIKYNMLNKRDRVVAAVSGGADSMFLLRNLKCLEEEFDLDIIVAHVNHGVRETAKDDEAFVKNAAEELNLKYEVIHIDMNEYAKENKLSSEEAGRLLRYDFFRKISGKDGKIFLAHNANDQAETVLFRITRGTGIYGLCAMNYIDKDLYRPMIDIKREEIEEYNAVNNISFVQDETNFMDIYSRNKLRLNVIPYIEDNFNENFIDALLRLSEISKENYGYIKKNITKILEKYYIDSKLKTDPLKTMDDYILSEVLREFIKMELKTLEGISKKNISEIIKMIREGQNSKINLPGNYILVFSYGSLYFQNEVEKLIIPEKELKSGKNRTEFGTIVVRSSNIYRVDNNMISIDADKVHGNLKVRNRRDGDKFMPFGMKHYKKLKNFFIDEKVDRYRRDHIPIITDDEEIIWVMPYRMSEKYSVDKDTERIINISLEDIENEGN